MERTKAIIADSHELLREGIASRLISECGMDVVGFAADGYSTIKQCRSLEPRLLMMDLGLLNPSGLDVLKRIRKSQPSIQVVLLSSEASAAEAFMALSHGAAGYLPKQAKGEHFVNSMVSVAMGYACWPNEYLQRFVDLRRNYSRFGNIYGLSPRELEILEECSLGAKNKDIASKLNISIRTVETHRNAIYRKTSTHSFEELKRLAEHLFQGLKNAPTQEISA